MVERDNEIKLRIESTIGIEATQEIDEKPTTTARELKERIAGMQAIGSEHIVLLHKGKPVPEGKTLAELGIVDGDVITVSPKAHEGGSALPPSFISQRISLESQHIRRNHIPLKPITPRHWQGPIQGVGRWTGKIFIIRIELPYNYPYVPPQVRFLRVPGNHPNINPDGTICLNLLRSYGWKPSYTMVTVYWGLQKLLKDPNYESPLPSYIAKQPSMIGGKIRGIFSHPA